MELKSETLHLTGQPLTTLQVLSGAPFWSSRTTVMPLGTIGLTKLPWIVVLHHWKNGDDATTRPRLSTRLGYFAPVGRRCLKRFSPPSPSSSTASSAASPDTSLKLASGAVTAAAASRTA